MNRDSVFNVLRAEPERTKLLMQVGGGGALALSLWAAIATMLLSPLAVFPLTLLLVGAYAAAAAVLGGALVRGADRWQVESAMQARRLMASGNSTKDSRRSPVEAAPATFDHWYFILRLDDEIKRARRYGGQVSVVIIKIQPLGGESPASTEQVNFDVASMAASHSKTMTMPSAIAPLEYAFVLPDTDRSEARARVIPLFGPLGDYWCEFGIAVYPDDTTDGESLVALARKEIEDNIRKTTGAPAA